jgi:hypothetical protein
MSMAALSPSVTVLQVTCSHCGHVREFERDERLTVDHLERMSSWRCIECSVQGGCVFAFFSYSMGAQRTLERLPTLLHDVTDA